MPEILEIPEVLVYGASVIHLIPPLLQNYYTYSLSMTKKTRERDLAEPRSSINITLFFEDKHGTHIFAK